jgi:hypothetical protein
MSMLAISLPHPRETEPSGCSVKEVPQNSEAPPKPEDEQEYREDHFA